MSRLRTTLRPAPGLLACSLLLSGCAASVVPPAAPPAPQPQVNQVPPSRPAPPPPASDAFRRPQVMHERGLDDVIGANANALKRLFGAPQLDTQEGDMRKMQFADDPCVLDVFLYPMREGGEPEATWVEARRKSDGLEVDRASCVAALRRN